MNKEFYITIVIEFYSQLPPGDVPPNCTGKLPPMDLTVQKVIKNKLKYSFQAWYA